MYQLPENRVRIRYTHSKLHSLSVDKLRKLLNSAYGSGKRPSFARIQHVWNLRSFSLLFVIENEGFRKKDLRDNMPKYLQFYPLQDTFSLTDIEKIITKQEPVELKPDLQILRKKDLLQYFIIRDPFTVYLEDDRHVRSIVSISEKNNLDFSNFLSSKKYTDFFLVSLDCEMVLTEHGDELGRFTLLNFDGSILADVYVMPIGTVIDYRTKYSGLSKESFQNFNTESNNKHTESNTKTDAHSNIKKLKCVSFQEAQNIFFEYVGVNTILLGHALYNDLKILKISHNNLIDTSRIYRTRDNHKISLKTLVQKHNCAPIQIETHCSAEDALACLQLLALKVESLNFLLNTEKSFSFVDVKRNQKIDTLPFDDRIVTTSFITNDQLLDFDIRNQINHLFIIFKEHNGRVYVGLYDSL